MTRPWTVVLLACFCSAIDVHALLTYEKKLDLLSTIVKQDYLWRQLFLESIYYQLDRTYYKHIIDDELLSNARYVQPATGEVQEASTVEGETSGGTPPETDTRDSIIPYTFVRNLMKKRFVLGSLLDMGLEVLMVSFKCLLYKHMVHMTTLINVEMKRNESQSKAASWSGKFKLIIESILMTMGALQFTDKHVLATAGFFDIYKTKSSTMSQDVKNVYIKQMENRSEEMLKYVKQNCVCKPIDDEDNVPEKQVANMLGVKTMDSLYESGASFDINKSKFKEMINSSQEMIRYVFGSTPRINGMPKTLWNDILHYLEIMFKKKQL